MSIIGGKCYIRATALVGLQEVVAESGGDIHPLMEECGIPAAALRQYDMPISYQRLSMLADIAAQKLNRPALAMEWALASEPHYPSAGPLVLIAKLGNTVQQWLENALKYWFCHTNAFAVILLDGPSPGQCTLRFCSDSFLVPSRQLMEHHLGILVRSVRTVTEKDDLAPIRVKFQHRRPKDLTLHTQLFRCDLQFDADHNEIIFDSRIMQMPTRRDLKSLRPLLLHYVKSRLDAASYNDVTMTTHIALAIPSIIGTGRCDIQFVADCLDMSVKKIQRQLAFEGTSFSEILERVRENMAKRHLAESDASIARIAGLLDYSATAPFTLAFRRWTNMSPLAFRKQSRLGTEAKVSAALVDLQ